MSLDIDSRKVDDLVRALGIEGISKSEVSRMCKALDEDVNAFLSRPIEGEPPRYGFADRRYFSIESMHRIDSQLEGVRRRRSFLQRSPRWRW